MLWLYPWFRVPIQTEPSIFDLPASDDVNIKDHQTGKWFNFEHGKTYSVPDEMPAGIEARLRKDKLLA